MSELKRYGLMDGKPGYTMLEISNGGWCRYEDVQRVLVVFMEQLNEAAGRQVMLETCLREGHHFGRYAHEEDNYEEPETCTRCGYVETEGDLVFQRRQLERDRLERRVERLRKVLIPSWHLLNALQKIREAGFHGLANELEDLMNG